MTVRKKTSYSEWRLDVGLRYGRYRFASDEHKRKRSPVASVKFHLQLESDNKHVVRLFLWPSVVRIRALNRGKQGRSPSLTPTSTNGSDVRRRRQRSPDCGFIVNKRNWKQCVDCSYSLGRLMNLLFVTCWLVGPMSAVMTCLLCLCSMAYLSQQSSQPSGYSDQPDAGNYSSRSGPSSRPGPLRRGEQWRHLLMFIFNVFDVPKPMYHPLL